MIIVIKRNNKKTIKVKASPVVRIWDIICTVYICILGGEE